MPAFAAPGSAKRKSEADDSASRKRQAVQLTASTSGYNGGGKKSGEEYWMVQWRAPQQRKHKTWDGDGVLIVAVNSGYCRLLDMDGKPIGSGRVADVQEGVNYVLGSKEIEIDRSVPYADYMSGACFGRGPATSVATTSSGTSTLTRKFVPLKPMALNPSVARRASSSASSSKVMLEPVNLVKVSEKIDSQASTPQSSERDTYWTANWRKQQTRKHKTWDGDAFVLFDFKQGKLRLISEQGKILGSTSWKGAPLFSGYKDRVGSREFELDAQIPASQMPKVTGTSTETNGDADQYDEWEVVSAKGPPARPAAPVVIPTSPANAPSSAKKFVAPISFYGKPLEKPKPKGPSHDPDAEGAVVMKAPTKEHVRKFNKKELPIVPVVVDPIIGRKLRPHQIEGVKFLYECVMGLRKHEGQGCILADEMGLGKTLQTITLVWTLLKQNPYVGAGPVVGKVLIVCPVSLVNNWKSEFHKWLGRDRVSIALGDKDKSIVKQFINSRDQVLIIGYEKLRTVIDQLAYCNPPIGLIICDEGHRLKSANNKTSKMFEALRTPRRIILSGTPIQNDLGEFHSMADFCNPGLLDDYTTFKRVFEAPILRSRAPECTSKDAELGEARIAQLHATAKSFVLRREATILKNYLPPKTEYVVFVTPTVLQLSIFGKILRPDNVDNIVEGSTAESLALIGLLTKISNSPILLKAVVDKAKNSATRQQTAVEEAAKLLPERVQPEDVTLSGKLTLLANLLNTLRKDTEEKCAIVSHYTSTLNVIEAYCQKKGYTYFRLDGQTQPAKRQEYVNSFNKATQASRFIFLLSAKAGGVGLNLIGASRLCLIDSDWNPSHDLQSMARIHRDGQKRPVFIYRFVTTGAIDEKIFQRQVTKLGLSNSLMGSTSASSKSDSFSRKELRDIFSVHPNTACHTHDLLDCQCDAVGGPVDDNPRDDNESSEDEEDEMEQGFTVASQIKPGRLEKMDKAMRKRKKAELAALGEWTHISCLQPEAQEVVQDDVLRRLLYRPSAQASKPKLQATSLLEATDFANIEALEAEAMKSGMQDLPPGAISFLFERTSSDPTPEVPEEVA